MPPKRYGKKRFKRRGRRGYKRYPRYRSVRGGYSSNAMHKFRRIRIQDKSISALEITNRWKTDIETWSLDQLSNYSDFTNLFAQFRIVGVKVTFIPFVTYNYASQAAGQMPILYLNRDHTGTASAWADESAVVEKQGITMRFFNKPISIYIKTNVLASRYEGPAATSYSSQYRQWLDTSETATPHYGLQWGCTIPPGLNTSYDTDLIRVRTQFYVQCKRPE